MHLLHSSHEVCNTYKITTNIYIPNPHYVIPRITLLSVTLKYPILAVHCPNTIGKMAVQFPIRVEISRQKFVQFLAQNCPYLPPGGDLEHHQPSCILITPKYNL